MLEAAYLAQCLPEPTTLLSRPLKPFSLGHYKILRRFQNAFVAENGETPATLGDLVFGVWVCSQTYAQAAARLSQRARPVPTLAFSLQPSALPYELAAWGKKYGKLKPERARWLMEQFALYIEAGSGAPHACAARRQGRMPGTPVVLRVELVLAQLNYGPAEINDCPWGEALHKYFGYWELEGAIEVISDEELAQDLDADLVIYADAARQNRLVLENLKRDQPSVHTALLAKYPDLATAPNN